MPFEKYGIDIENIFPEVHLYSYHYCEFSRLAILPEYRSMELLSKVIRALTLKAQAENHKYLFAVAPLVQSRCYRGIFNKMGLEYTIHPHINFSTREEECGDLRMYLSTLDLLPQQLSHVDQILARVDFYST